MLGALEENLPHSLLVGMTPISTLLCRLRNTVSCLVRESNPRDAGTTTITLVRGLVRRLRPATPQIHLVVGNDVDKSPAL